MSNDAWWRTGNETVFAIGGEEVQLVKKGAEYAAQFGRLTAWLGTHGMAGLMVAYESGVFEGRGVSDYELFSRLLSFILNEGVTPEAMVELSAVLIGKDVGFAEEYFDPGWMIDGLLILLDRQPGIKIAFSRLWDRFRMVVGPGSSDEEDQTQD